MSAHRARRRRTVAFFTGVFFLVGIAFAQWLATGTGSGTAKAVTAQALTTSQSTATADLFPGGTGSLTLTVVNPNPYPVAVTSVTGDGAITSDAIGCDAGNHGVTFADQTGLSLAVPAAGSATHVLPGAVAMAVTSADACQGATFTIPVALSGVAGDGDVEGEPGGGGGGEDTSDLDEDGFSVADGDCDDTNASIYPGATEIVGDGLDNNCDGQIDEGEPVCDDGDPTTIDTWDGEVCVHTSTDTSDQDADGYSVVNGDCDDTNPSVHPGAEEIVGDGIDNDCDGVIDES